MDSELQNTASPQFQRTYSSSSSRLGSRRTSQQLTAGTIPNILPSNTGAVLGSPQASSTMMPVHVNTDNSGVGPGPGPMRHPRPRTQAEMYLEMEKEQEAVVNRLTRELSLLRAAQNGSVQSNHSSVSGSLPDGQDTNHFISGLSHPTPSTRPGIHNRSTSSTSSISRPRTASQVSVNHIVDSNTSSRYPTTGASLSRQNSSASSISRSQSQRGEMSPSVAQPIPIPGASFAHIDRRQSLSRRDTSTTNISNVAQYSPSATGSEMGRDAPITSIPATGRYEEIAYWRAELEKQKEENERLRQRVRELEAVNRKEGREKERGRGAVRREGSLDTTVSVQGSVLSGGDEKGASPKKAEMDGLTGMMKKSHLDDEVVVGESAASVAAE